MKRQLSVFYKLYKQCKLSDSFFLIVLCKFILYKIFYNKNLFLHPEVTIKGVNNILLKRILDIGIGYIGFMDKKDKTLLNIQGKLIIKSKHYSIGRGCRFDIGKNAVVTIGSGGYINCNTKIIIMHSLHIGDNCIISWDCQFLDEDFHEINYATRNKKSDKGIVVGNNVWIGCGVKIYSGTIISDNSVIASNSVVRGQYIIPNVLIGGVPAKVLRKEVTWK